MKHHHSHHGKGHGHIGSHHGGHGTGHGGYEQSPHHGGAMSTQSNSKGAAKNKRAKLEHDPDADPGHHAMNEDCNCGLACGDTQGQDVGAYGGGDSDSEGSY